MLIKFFCGSYYAVIKKTDGTAGSINEYGQLWFLKDADDRQQIILSLNSRHSLTKIDGFDNVTSFVQSKTFIWAI